MHTFLVFPMLIVHCLRKLLDINTSYTQFVKCYIYMLFVLFIPYFIICLALIPLYQCSQLTYTGPSLNFVCKQEDLRWRPKLFLILREMAHVCLGQLLANDIRGFKMEGLLLWALTAPPYSPDLSLLDLAFFVLSRNVEM